MKNILIFGGAFNPPTLAHAAVIDRVINDNDYDQIWLMPCKDRSDKQMNTAANVRLQMLKAMANDCFTNYAQKLEVTDLELKLPGTTQTYKTMDYLKQHYPNYSFTWLIGADSWLSMDKWPNGTKIKKEAHWVIVSREGFKLNKLPANAKLIKSLFNTDLSSTMIRGRVANHIPALPYVSAKVNQIITKNKLYN